MGLGIAIREVISISVLHSDAEGSSTLSDLAMSQ
jgi:hypothetical protein